MRESRKYGSVRGALSNERPYRDRQPQLFKADNATLSFYATKDGKITVSYQGWDATKTVLDG